jgi:hypothetical protein
MILRTQFSDFFLSTMKPALELVIWNRYRRFPQQWSNFFNQTMIQGSIYQSSQLSGLGLMQTITEGAAVTYDQPVQGFDKTYTPARRGLGVQVSQDLVEDDTKLKLVAKKAGLLGASAKETLEIDMASVFNNAFSGNYTGVGGVSLCNASHPLTKAGGVQSNILSTAADLDNTSLELALTDYETMVSDANHKINLPLPRLVVAPANRWVAAEMLESKLRSDTANNATNAFKFTNNGAPDWFVWQYIIDSDAWFLVAQPEDTELHVIWRRKPYTRYGFDFDTETGKTAMRMKYDYGWSDFYGVYGTPGA